MGYDIFYDIFSIKFANNINTKDIAYKLVLGDTETRVI